MLIDITGTVLIPGNGGKDCPGNGERSGIECCCEECDYFLCCQDSHDPKQCLVCKDQNCPQNKGTI